MYNGITTGQRHTFVKRTPMLPSRSVVRLPGTSSPPPTAAHARRIDAAQKRVPRAPRRVRPPACNGIRGVDVRACYRRRHVHRPGHLIEQRACMMKRRHASARTEKRDRVTHGVEPHAVTIDARICHMTNTFKARAPRHEHMSNRSSRYAARSLGHIYQDTPHFTLASDGDKERTQFGIRFQDT